MYLIINKYTVHIMGVYDQKILSIGKCGQKMSGDHYSRKQNKWD